MPPTKDATDDFLGPLGFLVCGLPGQQRNARLLLMLVAHFDDSGTDGKNTTVAVLGGFIARAEDWHKFSTEWRKVLNGPPKLNYFRSVEAHRRRDEFRGFSVADRDDRLHKLYSLIADLRPLAIASVIRLSDFGEFQKGFRERINVYSVLFSNLVFNALNAVRAVFPDEKVELVFDDQGAIGMKAAGVADWAAQGLPEKYKRVLAGRPIHRSDKEILPIQAADALAWNLRRSITNETSLNNLQLPIEFKNISLVLSLMTREKLARMHSMALRINAEFPDVESTYDRAEMRAIGIKMLGYDSDDMP